MSKVQKNRILFGITSSLFILVLWYAQYQISINIPWWDDFHGIMLPVYNLFTDNTLLEKFEGFFSLNNEHRIVNDRLFMLAIYIFNGVFEMKTLALFGFINLIGIFLLLVKIAKPYVSNIWHLFPLVFLVFHFQYYESLQSLMVPFQNFSVILYALLSIFFVAYSSKFSIYYVALFSILSIFSHGNGILVFPVVFLLMMLQFKFKQAGGWILFSIIIILFYFWGYETPNWKLEEPKGTISTFDSLIYTFEFLGAYVLNIVDLSTSLSTSIFRKYIPFSAGILSIIPLVYYFIKKYPVLNSNYKNQLIKLRHSKIDLFLFGGISFFVATAIIMGITRANFPMLSRYTINSSMYLSLIYIYFLVYFKNKNRFIFICSIVSAFCLIFSYYNNYDKAIFFKNNLRADAINYQNEGTWINGYSSKKHLENLNPLLKDIYENNKYIFPEDQLMSHNKLKSTFSEGKLQYKISKGFLEIENNANNEEQKFYSLENGKHSYIFPATKKKNSIINLVKKMSYFSNKSSSAFPQYLAPMEKYKIFEITETQNGLIKIDTGLFFSPEEN